jgi:hypothetical protein
MAIYTNLVTNPRPSAASAAGWTLNSGTGGIATQSTITDAAGPGGPNARRAAWTTAPSNLGGGFNIGSAALVIPGTAGTTYSAAAYVRVSKAQRIVCRLVWLDAAFGNVGTIDGAPVVTTTNTWAEVKVEGQVAPVGTVNLRITVVSISGTGAVNWIAGDTIDVQSATIVASPTLPQPFNGSLSNTLLNTYAWTGTTDASTSTLNVVQAGVGTPQNVQGTAESTGSVTVTWNAVSGASSYNVRRGNTIVAYGVTGTSYTDTGLAPGSQYSYSVKALLPLS